MVLDGASDRVGPDAVGAGLGWITPPLNADRCCQRVCGLRYAGDMCCGETPRCAPNAHLKGGASLSSWTFGWLAEARLHRPIQVLGAQSGSVEEFRRAVVERPALEQFEVEVSRTPEDRLRPCRARDHG